MLVIKCIANQVKDGKENVRMKIYTGEALYENKSILMLKSIPILNNLIVNQCARSLLYPIPCMSIKAALTLSPAALLPPPSPGALGLIGPSKMDDICRAKTILMTSARSDQT